MFTPSEPDFEYTGDPYAALAVLAGFIFVIGIFAVIVYIINSIFLMKLLKNAGHRYPGSAWVPLWNTASLMDAGGLRGAWAWVGILYGGAFLANLIPYVGFIISLALGVLAIMLTVWVAKGVQEGLGLKSVGGIVLAVLLPLIWIIWMGVRSGKHSYSREVAFGAGGSFPLNWFPKMDPAQSFKA